jgi:hypothetical protein
VTWAVDFFQGPAFERLNFLTLPLLMLVFFLILISDRLRFESGLQDQLRTDSEQRKVGLAEFLSAVQKTIESRLPGIELIRGKQQVEAELTKTASEAKRFIIATGGKSRIKTYLDTITRKASDENVPYTRIIFGGYIHHELCTHLCSVVGQSRVRIAHAPDEKSGTALVTENALIFTTIPSTEANIFDTIVKVPDPTAADEYREYLIDLLVRSKTLDSSTQIRSLCTACSKASSGQREESP